MSKRKHSLHVVPPPGEEWIAGRFSMPAYVNDRDPPYRPDAVVWLSEVGILHAGLVHPADPPEVIGQALQQAMQHPMVGSPRRPASVRVHDQALVPSIRAVLGEGVAIHVRPTPEMEEVRELLSQMPHREDDDESAAWAYDPSIPQAVVAGFHRAAARLYQAAPWDQVPDDGHVLSLSVPALGIQDGCVSVIGQMGESYGLLFYRSLGEYVAFRRVAIRAAGRGQPPRTMAAEVFSVNFESGADVPAKVRQRFMREGLELASPDAYPIILRADADLVPRPLREQDVVLGWVMCEALASFLKRHGVALAEGFTEVLRETYKIEVGGGVEATVTAPHPQAEKEPLLVMEDWGQGGAAVEDEDEDFDEEDLDEEEDDLDDEEDEAISDFAGEFLEAQDARGRDADWLDRAEYICESLCDYKMGYLDGDLSEWGGGEIEEFMMDFIPRKVIVDDDMLDRVPEVLSAFAEWLADTGRMPRREAEALRRRLEKQRGAFRRRARDPSLFGPAKALFGEMQAQGVDIDDEDEVQAFIDHLNAQNAPGKPRGGPARPGPAPTTRWQPAPGERQPFADDPCPCGSGRRYKKCCKPR